MTDLEKELTRQIHELSKELAALRERVAVLEYKQLYPTPPVTMPNMPSPTYPPQKNPWDPPFIVTCAAGNSTGIAGRD
jgi:hypothetical protein